MKIAFTGPESSGKTSISKAVANLFDATWYSEYAREYLLQNDGKYNFDDLEKIARKQEEIRTVKTDTTFSIYDTEATVFYIWSHFNYKKCAPYIQKLYDNQQIDHYFLCSPEGIPWEEDPLREHPMQREELFDLYLKELKKQYRPFTILTGNSIERKRTALLQIEKISLNLRE